MRAAEAAPCAGLRSLDTPGDLEPGSALALLLICCFTLGKFLALSGPALPHLQREDFGAHQWLLTTSWGWYRDRRLI